MTALIALSPKSCLKYEACFILTSIKFQICTNFFESGSANKNPLLASIISQIIALSGNTIDMGRKRFFIPIGNSVLPAYPGLRDMKIDASSFKVSLRSPKFTNLNYCLRAFCIWVIITVIWFIIYGVILLNSSIRAQLPLLATPLNSLVTSSRLNFSDALNTWQGLPKVRLKSLAVSVFPVPKGPSIAPPN